MFTCRNITYLLNYFSRASHITGHIDVDISDDLSKGSIIFPGFSYESLDRRGKNSRKKLGSLDIQLDINFDSYYY